MSALAAALAARAAAMIAALTKKFMIGNLIDID